MIKNDSEETRPNQFLGCLFKIHFRIWYLTNGLNIFEGLRKHFFDEFEDPVIYKRSFNCAKLSKITSTSG